MVSEEKVCSFVHASDLHIGKFQYTNPYRAIDYIEALRNLLYEALRYSADFILLAGDVFNSIDLLPYLFTNVIDVLRKFHQKTQSTIPIVSIEGNHDIRNFSKGNHISHNESWLKVLSNLGLIILLDESLDDPERNKNPLDIKDVKIFGNSYCGETIDSKTDAIMRNIPINGSFNILINHFGIDGQMKGIPGQLKVKLDNNLKSRIHYLALGHFHKQYILDDYIFNPGCLSSACLSDFSLPHGFFLVSVTKDGNYSINIQKTCVPERNILWKTIVYKGNPRSKNQLLYTIESRLKKEIPLNTTTQTIFKNTSAMLPILCLTLHTPTGKILSSGLKKELRSQLLQSFKIIEVHIYERQITYKHIENFFLNADSPFSLE